MNNRIAVARPIRDRGRDGRAVSAGAASICLIAYQKGTYDGNGFGKKITESLASRMWVTLTLTRLPEYREREPNRALIRDRRGNA